MEVKSDVEHLMVHVKDYAETRFDLIVLTIQEKVSDVISSMVSYLVFGILLLFMLFFVSMGSAMYIGKQLHDTFLGFMCVACFYLVLALIAFIGRRPLIKTPLTNAFIKKIKIHEEN